MVRFRSNIVAIVAVALCLAVFQPGISMGKGLSSRSSRVAHDTQRNKYSNERGKEPAEAPAKTGRIYGNEHNKTATAAPEVKGGTFVQRANSGIASRQSKEALKSYNDEKARFKGVSRPTDYTRYRTVTVIRNVNYDSDTYLHRRGVLFVGYHPPVYVYSLSPSYGMWDTMFLAYALDHIQERRYAQMFYNHQSDPDFQQWRREAERNGELKAKLDAANAEIAKLNGTPVNPDYVPPEVGDLAFNKEALDAAHSGNAGVEQAAMAGEDQRKHGGFPWMGMLLLMAIIFGAVALAAKAVGKKKPESKWNLKD